MSVEVTFLGTSSGAPTKERNVSGTCIQLPGSPNITLIDCGEGTQHRFQLSTLKVGKLNHILLTHSHGDHIFGLPGLLCSMSGSHSPDLNLVTITGPLGLKHYLLSALAYSDSQLNFDLCIREIIPPHISKNYLEAYESSINHIPQTEFQYFLSNQNHNEGIIERFKKSDTTNELNEQYEQNELQSITSDDHDNQLQDQNNNLNEEAFGEDGEMKTIRGEYIHYDHNLGGYEIFNEFNHTDFKILAAPIKHRVFCVGYVFIEKDQLGALNVSHLKSKFGLNPGPFCSKLKSGESVTIEHPNKKNETITIHPEDVLGPTIKGRKLVFLGDTHNPYEISHLAKDCDFLVHESTLENRQKAMAIERGHSVPSMAATFAKSISSKRLILSHFSARFPKALKEGEDPTTTTLQTLQEQAIEIFGPNVEIAEDLKKFEIKKNK